MSRTRARGAMALLAACVTWACQSPTATDTTTTEFIDTVVSPDPATAAGPTGRFYTFVSTNNQPNEQREYDWKTSFAVAITLNSNSTDDNVDLAFPAKISAATIRVQQASGGIITPPTGSDVEHYEFESRVATNVFGAVNSTVNMDFDVWYDLPSLKREALVTVSLTFTDDDGKTFSRTVDVRVSP
jgi:predicted flavoprotein YhiN